MFESIILSVLLVIMTSFIHYWSLIGLSRFARNTKIYASTSVLITILLLFLVHLVEIGLYGFVYHESVEALDIGTLSGLDLHETFSYLYFSLVTYTSLGVSNIYPEGHIRLIAGIETLNGLLLIGWSGSYTFLMMKRYWHWE